ncbi:MAG: pseudaminic acid cytidylyltransferase [Lachnospiraceae bacterium]|nr:pseudaminic acid cytidylyltransferase [Lachnospiraceae bacterium]
MIKTLAMITARGGSKRIPRKNIKDFNGKPIIAYSIEAALNSGVFDTVMVSTDDDEIADIAKKYGAEVPFMRSAKTSDDHATTSDVIEEVLKTYESKGTHFDIAACIYPTAPFITADRLKEAVGMLTDAVYKGTGDEGETVPTASGSAGPGPEKADTVIPVVRYSYPPQRAYEIRDGILTFRAPEYMDARSQDLSPWYHDAGQFYVFKTDSFLRTKKITAGTILPMVISETEVQDIDTEEDWVLAELKYKLMLSAYK